MIRKDFRDDPCLFYKSGRDFRVETFPGMPSQADGELLHGTPLDVSVDPLAGTLLIPKRK
jgi:diacylglycerol kinase family enzyme